MEFHTFLMFSSVMLHILFSALPLTLFHQNCGVCVCTAVSLTSTAAEREVRVTVSVSTQLEPCLFPHNIDEEGIEIPMCRVSVELVPHSPLSKVQVSIIVHPPLTVSQVSHTISSLCKL